jgi:hypothetical protein
MLLLRSSNIARHVVIRLALIHDEHQTEDGPRHGRLESVSEVIGMLASSRIGIL